MVKILRISEDIYTLQHGIALGLGGRWRKLLVGGSHERSLPADASPLHGRGARRCR
jgi:hypothetical protein